MRHIHLLLLLPILPLAMAPSCTGTEPCDDYVDYMCACHQDDPAYDCEAIQTVYAEAGPDLQDECAIQLDDQQATDSAAGVECQW